MQKLCRCILHLPKGRATHNVHFHYLRWFASHSREITNFIKLTICAPQRQMALVGGERTAQQKQNIDRMQGDDEDMLQNTGIFSPLGRDQ